MINNLTIIIIVGNESEMIAECLKTCNFVPKIILVTTPATTPKTIAIAKTTAKNIIITKSDSDKVDFSSWRNAGAKLVKTDWILYVDADERVTPELQNEIELITNQKDDRFTNYDIPRFNFFLGHRVKYGNTYPDYVKRLFLKKHFKGYHGLLHEQPQVSGPSQKLKSPFLHYTHRNLTSMLQKSLQWTPLESQLLFVSGHPPVVWWRIIRMMLTKLFERLIRQSMWRDGIVGWISAIFEAFDTFLIYSQLWELQQKHD